jgi:ribosomal protein L13
MLPKGVLGRSYYRRLFIYSDNNINYIGSKEEVGKSISLELCETEKWRKINL